MSTLVTTALRHNASASNNMVLDSNGRVGIGTATPSRRFDIQESSTNYQLRIGDAGTNFYDIGRDTGNGLLTFFGNQTVASGYVFSTVNGERMRIDTSGRVTTPAQPMFHAFSSGMSNIGISGSNNFVAIPNAVLVNVGSHYSTSTGRFTAPVAGTYMFYAQVPYTGVSGAAFTGIVIRRNSSGLTDGYNSGSYNYSQAVASVIVTLAASDFVDVIASYNLTSGNVEASATGRLYFGGYLIG